MRFEKKHILLVDDNERLLDSFKCVLEQTVDDLISTATNGKEARSLIMRSQNGKAPVNLLITDMDMPLMNGLELIDELKKNLLMYLPL